MVSERARSDSDHLATLEFADGRFVLYDPENPDAWLLLDPG